MFTPGNVTRTAPHVRDGLDVKRLMITVVAALGPIILFALYNTGYQALYAFEQGALPRDDWQMAYCQAELYAEYMLEKFGKDALARILKAFRANCFSRVVSGIAVFRSVIKLVNNGLST